MTWGGEGNCRIWSEEEKKERSNITKGSLNPMFGKNPLDYMTEEARKERKRKLSEKSKGENNPFYGKRHTKETLEKISGKNHHMSRAVICITTGLIFDTAKEGGEYYNCSSSTICDCCKNKIYQEKKIKSAGHLDDGTKLVWMFLEDYKNANEEEIQEKIKDANIRTDKRAKSIICITTGEIFGSVRKCAKHFNVNHGRISECCKGDREFIVIDGAEYRFKYLDEIND